MRCGTPRAGRIAGRPVGRGARPEGPTTPSHGRDGASLRYPAAIGTAELPRELRAFVERCLTNAAQLEVLLLLHEHRDRAWTATDVSRALRVEADQARAALDHLARMGLLSPDEGGFRLGPGRPRDAKLVARLADLYPTYRVAIISIIFSRPSGPIRDFSDAFRLRDED